MRTTPNQDRSSPRSEPASPRVPDKPDVARGASRKPGPVARLLRGLSGSLAAGVCVLALVVTVMHFWSLGQGQQGPEITTVLGQVMLAGLALVAQRIADRDGTGRGHVACALVFALVFGVLWFWWW